MSDHRIEIDRYSVYIRNRGGSALAHSTSAEAFLLYEILQRLPDPAAPLGEAVEWENEAGTQRTTDRGTADNWQAYEKVRVVRRAAP